jgi:hypothetical protein
MIQVRSPVGVSHIWRWVRERGTAYKINNSLARLEQLVFFIELPWVSGGILKKLCWPGYFKQLECSAALETLDAGLFGKVVTTLARLPSGRRRRVPDQGRIGLRRAACSTFGGDTEGHGGSDARAEKSAVGQLAEEAA